MRRNVNFHGGQYKKNGINDFSVNIPQIPFDSSYQALLTQTICKLYDYPEIDGETARDAVSNYLNWPSENIVLGNGATDLIYLIARAYRFKRAMIMEPTFTEYRRALMQSGSEMISYHLNRHGLNESLQETHAEDFGFFEADPKDVARTINQYECDALYVCNPNNPTGTFFNSDFFEEILKNVNTASFTLVIDESFIEFTNQEVHHESMNRLMKRYNVLVIRSMTKTFSVPGLRIGYVFGDKNAVDPIAKLRDPWAVNRFALESIPYFLNNKMHLKKLQAWCEKEKYYLMNQLSGLKDITVYQATANFILIHLSNKQPTKWHEALIQKGFYLRTCLDFIGLDESYFRIAVKDRVSSKQLIEAIISLETEQF